MKTQKEIQSKDSFQKKCMQTIAKRIRTNAEFWINYPCSFWNYQPKVSDKLKKLRKF